VAKTTIELVLLAQDADSLSPEEFAGKHGKTFLLFMPVDESRYDREGLAATRMESGPAAYKPSDPGAFLICAVDAASADAVLIGRATDCDIVIPDDSVSANHAYLCRKDKGWVVFDAKSKNGTWVNEIDAPALSSGEQGVPLEAMSRMRLGGFEATIVEAPQLQKLARSIMY
jgi:hypothetical protein